MGLAWVMDNGVMGIKKKKKTRPVIQTVASPSPSLRRRVSPAVVLLHTHPVALLGFPQTAFHPWLAAG